MCDSKRRYVVERPSIGKTLIATTIPVRSAHVFGPIRSTYRLTAPQIRILKKAARCLEDPGANEAIRKCILGESKFSLRLLDWFVTSYARTNATLVPCATQTGMTIYDSYRSALIQFKRRDFDPFRRSMRRKGDPSTILSVEIITPNKEVIKTTVGQLNFLCWAQRNSILDYIEANCKDIEDTMHGTEDPSMSIATPCQVMHSSFCINIG
jgi:hypothetical protein